MDRFDATLRTETIALVDRLAVDRHALALSRIELFSATLHRLLVENGERYDALVTAGTSGLYMQALARATYRLLAIEPPPTICLPIVRFAEGGALFDNTSLAAEVCRQLGEKRRLERVLFVDDEIRRGTVAHACFDLLLRSDCVDAGKGIVCTIVAENHFFEWHWDQPGIAVRYLAPARLLYGLQHNIAHCLPNDLREEARRCVDPKIGHHELMAMVVAGSVKRMRGDTAFFDEAPARLVASRIPDFQARRERFLLDFEGWVQSGVRKYRDGEIRFRF
ncbi:MAG: hypothetical protein JSR90_12830 [Proteobacteria bacterium]|nr:hypothetical protein [Pseudomonadota bacterium]